MTMLQHMAKPIRDMLEALAEQRFGSYEDVKKQHNEWFATKG